MIVLVGTLGLMRRWHEDRNLMLARWSQEIGARGAHPAGSQSTSTGSCFCRCGTGPRPPLALVTAIGAWASYEKSGRLIVAGTRCGLCHPDKRTSRQQPAEAQRALGYEWDASGGW